MIPRNDIRFHKADPPGLDKVGIKLSAFEFKVLDDIPMRNIILFAYSHLHLK